MDPVNKDPGSKEIKGECNQANKRVDNRCNGRVAKDRFAKEGGVWVGLQPQRVAIVCNQPRSVDVGPPRLPYIIFVTV